ncbi:hypothetical protein BB559_002219 [Furculomyces boomerangus]|uniref:Uncharacterized protein n=2 Tax=Harpellales TaxID=61421 RepID=A0A2T9YX06_9FUNG|nr:hypothetical protein BB559_002219 [Furculomyces boomerangus]PWA02360.1 hypothetical protein BB558_001498 [Smittium angustum]
MYNTINGIKYDDAPVGWANVGVAAGLLSINGFLSMFLGLNIGKTLTISAIRCVVQLTVMALVLKKVLSSEIAFYSFFMTSVLAALAAYEITYWRINQRIPGMYASIFVSIYGSSLFIGVIGNMYAMNTKPAWAAYKFIPIMGMLLGNCMIGITMGVKSIFESTVIKKDQIEMYLAYGATRWEIAKPILITAMRSALIPTINNMSITGLISIPGMMTGQILGGADVMQATHYQQIIMFLISASTALGSIIATLYILLTLVDGVPRLRIDKLIDTKKQKTM